MSRSDTGSAKGNAQIVAECRRVVAETRAACTAGQKRTERVGLWARGPADQKLTELDEREDVELPCADACAAPGASRSAPAALKVYGLRLTALLDADFGRELAPRVVASYMPAPGRSPCGMREQKKKKKKKATVATQRPGHEKGQREEEEEEAARNAAADFTVVEWGERPVQEQKEIAAAFAAREAALL